MPKYTFANTWRTKVVKNGECLEWQGMTNAYGYGIVTVTVNGKERHHRAHRLVYESEVGQIPDGLVVMHACDNPRCVNPAHLSLGGRTENNRDSVAKGRNAAGSRNGHAKLSNDDVRAIFLSDLDQPTLAKRFNIDQSVVSRIRTRKYWKSVTNSLSRD